MLLLLPARRESSLRLALYVHDLKIEIGHSNSLIELIRHLPSAVNSNIEQLEIISYTSSPAHILFPELNGKVIFRKVPCGWLKPVLLKSIFFQIWTALYSRLFQGSGVYKIGIGISSLVVDAVSVQFIHHQWTERGLQMERGHLLRRLYKKILFSYFEACERFLFSRPGIKIFSPAKFLTDFFHQNFPAAEAVTIYSGVNLKRFEMVSSERQTLFEALRKNYPVLNGLDLTRPIFLFVGAYERKGLPEALEILRSQGQAQIIVIGSPSLGKTPDWPTHAKVYPITFTKEIPLFYALADAFVFPTFYEPFGLVLFEAMSMGLTIVTRLSEVGASELLQGLPEVYFCDSNSFSLPIQKKKSLADKQQLRAERLGILGDVSWVKASAELKDFLSFPAGG